MGRTRETVKIKARPDGAGRALEAEIHFDAPVERVWKALTDGEELSNWFPAKARVEPGVGGSVWLWWGGDGESCEIEAWEPERHLRTVWPGAHAADPAVPVAVDYHLEGKGGGTTLRLVHSGFSADAEWDDEFDAHRRGWSFELRCLQHYLRRHHGTRRHLVKVQTPLTVSHEEGWARMMGRRGLAAKGSLEGLGEGDRYTVTTAAGDLMSGEVRLSIAPTDLAVTVEGLNFSLLRLSIERFGYPDGPIMVQLWLSAYGVPEAELQDVERRWQVMLEGLFAKTRVA